MTDNEKVIEPNAKKYDFTVDFSPEQLAFWKASQLLEEEIQRRVRAGAEKETKEIDDLIMGKVKDES